MDSTSTCSVLHDTKNNKLEANFLLKQWEINNERINSRRSANDTRIGPKPWYP